jgi:hypothetical protein
LSDFGVDNRCKGSVDKSLAAYKDALDVAVAELPPTDPLRLDLALNFSLFCYEILDSRDRAVHAARQALDDALAGLDDLPDTNCKDSALIMQLLWDNINLWTSDKEGMFHIHDISTLDWFTGKFTVKTEPNLGENDVQYVAAKKIARSQYNIPNVSPPGSPLGKYAFDKAFLNTLSDPHDGSAHNCHQGRYAAATDRHGDLITQGQSHCRTARQAPEVHSQGEQKRTAPRLGRERG